MPHICYQARIERYERIKQLRADGCSYKQIADRLGICRNTVGTAVAGKYLIKVKPKQAFPYNLSKSELPIARLLSEGKSNNKIAELLVLSRKTVDWHVYTIYKKLGILNDPSIHRRVVATFMLKDILEGDRYN